MARKPRVHLAGAIYHVIARGNNREMVFQCEADKETYLQLLSHYKMKFKYNLYAYVLMDNHIHLLICVADQPLSKIMQGIQLSYTQYYNKKYDRVGHVFQQRYKAMLCMCDMYLLNLVKYIHVNPAKSGLSKDLNYHWSSHQQYLKLSSVLVDTSFILGLFAVTREQRLEYYKKFMSVEDADVIEPKQYYVSGLADTDTDIVSNNVVMSLYEVLSYVSRTRNVAVELMCGLSRVKSVLDSRKIFIYIATKYYGATAAKLAQILRISSSQISRDFYSVVRDKDIHQQAERSYFSLKELQQCKA